MFEKTVLLFKKKKKCLICSVLITVLIIVIFAFVIYLGWLFSGGRYEKVLNLILIDNDNNTQQTEKISEVIILKHLLSERTLNLIRELENADEFNEDEKLDGDKVLKILGSNIIKDDVITEVEFYKNKMKGFSDSGSLHHKFIVFKTNGTGGEFWWSMEKNTKHFIMQRSSGKDAKEAVVNSLEGEPRLSVTQLEEMYLGKGKMYDLFQIMLVYGMIGESYNLFKSNCQQIVEFLSNKITAEEHQSLSVLPYAVPSPLDNPILDEFNIRLQLFNFSSWSPIEFSIYMDNLKLLEKVFQDYDFINSKKGINILRLAITFSRTQIVNYLLNLIQTDTFTEEYVWNYMSVAAYFSNSREMMDLLWNANKTMDANIRANTNQTLLHFAVTASNVMTTGYLIEKGADPNAPTNKNVTLLHYATRTRNNTKVIDVLLNTRKVNIEARDISGWTPLHYAIMISTPNVENARHLLARGADPRVRNKGTSPLEFAAIFGENVELINLLLETGKVHIDDVNENGNTVLHQAVMKSNALTARHLIEKGANPNAIDLYNKTALHMAAAFANNTEIIDVLLEYLNVDAPIIDTKATSLHAAVQESNFLTTCYLIEKGADPTAHTNKNVTPLHFAASFGNDSKIIDVLLNTGRVNIEALDELGSTPLHYAIGYSNILTTRHLLIKGANPRVRDNNGSSPLDLAAYFGKDVELIDLLLQTGKVHVDDFDEKTGKTALHLAVMASNILTTRHLIKKGANPNVHNNDKTPLLLAARFARDIELIKLLIDQHANIFDCDDEGNNIIDYSNENKDEFLAKSIISLLNEKWKPEVIIKLNQKEYC